MLFRSNNCTLLGDGQHPSPHQSSPSDGPCAQSCTTLHLLNFDGTLDNRQLAPYTALVKKVRHANLEYPNEFTPLVREMDSLGSLVLHQTKFSSTHPITNDNYEASSSSPSSHRIPRFSPCFNLALLTSRPYPSME